MKVKNVLKGLMQKYCLEEVHIIDEDRVIYSGSLTGWRTPDIDMILFKKDVENMPVVRKLIFNGKKAFVFVGNPFSNPAGQL